MVSICVFGSCARKTDDDLSDRDVLIMSENLADADTLRRDWKIRGWNSAVFTPQALKRMIEVKALFIQHLKVEGIIIRDDDNTLQALIANFVPKSDYLLEMVEASAALARLRFIRGSYWVDACIADASYVFFRNYLILLAASEQRYIFDYMSLLEFANEKLPLSVSQMRCILSLRAAKNAYRHRLYNPLVITDLQQAQVVISLIVAKTKLSAPGDQRPLFDDWYIRLRESEIRLLETYDPTYLDDIASEHPLFAKWTAIRNSGGYPKPRVHRQFKGMQLSPL